ncbi:hypothetical protein EVAR_5110_1 [Eumeta japonica]|uniref:CCHC-type domain-containing protein n=1 Tax=Eumeta variegata TaxID=151549 RepID=A0A4C1SV89_EUMVA|nr:hypothetical protein EVAR_5110_1 [Eumeta japonica]
MKRKIPHDDREGSDLKRLRPGTSNAVTCYHCGKLGHKASQCYRRNVKPDVRLDFKHLRAVTVNRRPILPRLLRHPQSPVSTAESWATTRRAVHAEARGTTLVL